MAGLAEEIAESDLQKSLGTLFRQATSVILNLSF